MDIGKNSNDEDIITCRYCNIGTLSKKKNDRICENCNSILIGNKDFQQIQKKLKKSKAQEVEKNSPYQNTTDTYLAKLILMRASVILNPGNNNIFDDSALLAMTKLVEYEIENILLTEKK